MRSLGQRRRERHEAPSKRRRERREYGMGRFHEKNLWSFTENMKKERIFLSFYEETIEIPDAGV